MKYVLNGFTTEREFRVFAFDCIADDRARTQYTVRANLLLTRKYGIRVQELPLLCRGILERRNEGEDQRTFTYTEAEMCAFCAAAQAAVDAAARKRKARRALTENTGAAWRGQRFEARPAPGVIA